MNKLLFFIALSIALLLNVCQVEAQDAYHTFLKNQLQTNYGVTGGTWVFGDNETIKMNDVFTYNTTLSSITVSGQPFTQGKNIKVTAPGAFPYSNSVLLTSKAAVNAGDRALLVVWIKGISAADGGFGMGQMKIERSGPPYEQELTVLNQYSNGWTQYIFPFEFVNSYAAGQMHYTLQVGLQVQELELGGVALINYGTNYTLAQLPQENFNDYYPGIEANAQWRTDANNRIEQLRKSDLTVKVVDTNGNPINNATVNVDMECHEFAFGSAVVSNMFAGNSLQNNTYQDKIINMDGKGHGFNMIVFENDLKWRGWEGNYPGTTAEKVIAIDWLLNRGIRIRGHTLVWPGWGWMPDYMQANQNNPQQLLQYIDSHLNNILNHPSINGKIEEWDVLNEITPNRDLEFALAADPNYTTGREVYPEIFNKTAALDPNTKLYINDYMTITSGGLLTGQVDQYKSYLDELNASTTNFDGIGFQAHVNAFPVAPEVVYNILEDFHVSYGKEMKITEFDMKGVNPSIGYEYMRDFLTATFSHEGVNGFLMWGFWDGQHWYNDSPIYDINWNLKASGQAFIDLVFNNWWTNEVAQTNSAGETTIRAFRGKHVITISANGITQTVPVDLGNSQTIQIVLNGQGCPLAGTPCDDNDVNTASDIEDGNCGCAGSPIINNDYCNLLDNGDFRDGMTSWVSWVDPIQAVNQEAHCIITTPGPDAWSVGLAQSGITLVEGTTYELTFTARASTARTIGVKVGLNGTPYDTYYYGVDNLSTSMNSFTHTFTMNDPAPADARVEFHVGEFNGDVVIDNVRFAETSCSFEDCDLVGPADFSAGLGNFVALGCTATVGNGEVFIDIPGIATNPWDVQFRQENVGLELGKQYEITFDARAEYGRVITLKTGSSIAPFPQYSYSAFELSSTMKSYRTIITMLEPSDAAARFEFFLGNSAANVYMDNINLREIGCGATTHIDLTLLLEGCFDDATNQMASNLNALGVLPAQSNNNDPAGNVLPYAADPWNYSGTELSHFDNNIYVNMAEDNGHGRAIDWILVEFRTDITPFSSVGKKAALLMNNGKVVFPEPVDFLTNGQSYYVKVDHWSHIGILSPSQVTVTDRMLTFNFTTQNSYIVGASVASKEVQPGIWAMYGGNCDQSNESPGYDVNGSDKQYWNVLNGLFSSYNSADMNMDGDINGDDRILWEGNNGLFSELKR